ncbi:MAG: pilus assembly protein PilP [Candidatus Methylumidiphilus sp.]
MLTHHRLLAIACIAASLSACGGGDLTDLQDWVAAVKKRHKGAVEPLPEIKTVEPFVFKPEDLRDPFVQNDKSEQVEETKGDNGIHPDTTRAKEELESYELDSLRMVGTINQNAVLWALVRAVDGTIHRVRVGNHMGRNFGKIIRIREGQIELLEIIPDSPGGWRERKASLDLADASGGKK